MALHPQRVEAQITPLFRTTGKGMISDGTTESSQANQCFWSH